MSKRIVEISPSVLGADLMRLGEEIKMAESLGIHWLHLDNMDGHFAPNISFGPAFSADGSPPEKANTAGIIISPAMMAMTVSKISTFRVEPSMETSFFMYEP